MLSTGKSRAPLRRESENSMDLDSYPRESIKSSSKKKKRETLDAAAASSLEQIFSQPERKRRETIEPGEARKMSSELGLIAPVRRETIDSLALRGVRLRIGDAADDDFDDDLEGTVEGTTLANLGARLHTITTEEHKSPKLDLVQQKKQSTAAEACRALLGAAWGIDNNKQGRTGFEFASAATHLPLPTNTQALPAPPRSCLKSNPRRQITSPTVRFELDRSEIRTFHDNEPSTNLTPVDKSISMKYVTSEPSQESNANNDPRRLATVANSRTLAQWKMNFDHHAKFDRHTQKYQRRRASGTFCGIDSDSSDNSDDDNDKERAKNHLPISQEKKKKFDEHYNFVDDQQKEEKQLEKLPPLNNLSPVNDEQPVAQEEHLFLARQSPNTTARLTPIDEIMEETPVDETVQLEPNLSALLLRTQEETPSSSKSSSTNVENVDAFVSLGIDDILPTNKIILKPPCNPSQISDNCRPILARVLATSARAEAERCAVKANSIRANNNTLAIRLLTRSTHKELNIDNITISPPSTARFAKDFAARIRAEAAAIESRAADIEAGTNTWKALEADARRLAEMANAVRAAAIHSLKQRCTHLEQRLAAAQSARDTAATAASTQANKKTKRYSSSETRLGQLRAPQLAKVRRQLRVEADLLRDTHGEAACWRRLELAEGLHSWRLRAVYETELLLGLPHAVFGDWLQVQLSREKSSILSKTPRLVITRTSKIIPAFHLVGAESGIAFDCLNKAPALWLHPRAREASTKHNSVAEVLLNDLSDAPTALERMSFFASRLEALARELFVLDIRCGHNVKFHFESEQSALLQLELVASNTAQISLAFRIRRAYPDPAARASATLLNAQNSNNLLSLALRPLRGPDANLAALNALQALDQRGFIDSNLGDLNLSNNLNTFNDDTFLTHAASGIPAAMPGPGAILDITSCIFNALGLEPLT
uniref:Uncharacterized protein n=1 Tax=Aureoumbra lagunensis TaxID=44058 RepID=A0A7S3NKY4_9STRA